MALPEPTPPVTGQAAAALKKRLEKEQLSSSEREQYRGAKAYYQRKKP